MNVRMKLREALPDGVALGDEDLDALTKVILDWLGAFDPSYDGSSTEGGDDHDPGLHAIQTGNVTGAVPVGPSTGDLATAGAAAPESSPELGRMTVSAEMAKELIGAGAKASPEVRAAVDASLDELEEQLRNEHEAATFWQTKYEQLERDVAAGSAGATDELRYAVEDYLNLTAPLVDLSDAERRRYGKARERLMGWLETAHDCGTTNRSGDES